MKIIKPGITRVVTKRFTCQDCGCVFEASSKDGIGMIETTEHLFRPDTVRHFVPVCCPTCGKLHEIDLD